MTSELRLPSGVAERSVARIATAGENGWAVDDAFHPCATSTTRQFLVGWQFAPGWQLERASDRRLRLTRGNIEVRLEVSAAWSNVEAFTGADTAAKYGDDGDLVGACSPAFRKVTFGPALLLTGQAQDSCVFRTTFLASLRS